VNGHVLKCLRLDIQPRELKFDPGPHGPEIWAVSSTETVFEGFEHISCRPRSDKPAFGGLIEPWITT